MCFIASLYLYSFYTTLDYNTTYIYPSKKCSCPLPLNNTQNLYFNIFQINFLFKIYIVKNNCFSCSMQCIHIAYFINSNFVIYILICFFIYISFKSFVEKLSLYFLIILLTLLKRQGNLYTRCTITLLLRILSQYFLKNK